MNEIFIQRSLFFEEKMFNLYVRIGKMMANDACTKTEVGEKFIKISSLNLTGKKLVFIAF